MTFSIGGPSGAAERSRAVIDPHSPLSYKPPTLAVILAAEPLPNVRAYDC